MASSENVEPGAVAPALEVKGGATAEEVAALVVVLQAAAVAPAGADRPRPSEWSAPHRQHRQPPRTGHNAWKASALPH